MERPPHSTVIFSNIPSEWIAGIDLHFFNTNNVLKGIKNIPNGIHVVHFAADQSSIRTGHYFEAKEGEIIYVHWDEAQEKLEFNDEMGELNISKELSKLPEYFPFMINSPQDEFGTELTKFIKLEQLHYILPKNNRIDSVLTSTDENNLVLDALQKSAKNRNLANDPIVNSIIDQTNEEIKYTLIDLNKTIRPNSSPAERTTDALDKSWFLQNLLISGYNSNEGLLLGEFQLAFLNMVIFANFSSSVQWLKILRVILSCKTYVENNPSFFVKFLKQLNLQFQKLPEEYFEEFINSEFLQTCIGEFKYTVKDLKLQELVENVEKLESLLSSRFGVNIQESIEDDDDMPVTVDLI